MAFEQIEDLKKKPATREQERITLAERSMDGIVACDVCDLVQRLELKHLTVASTNGVITMSGSVSIGQERQTCPRTA